MRYADSAADLQMLIHGYPDLIPSVFLRDDGLAAYYYDGFSLRELRSFFNSDPDQELCGRFGLGAGEWREAVEMALVARAVLERRRSLK
ncbi:hypothetical protein [Desulfobotulus mexicanus]|uniref:Uncharacterized protein n=1 Tax=Desulfobotulus mexicanus TaxID=2586642 RepID=A0A5Q4VI51_9BACT|nr:hypothetical protein [Desulfobotulus mexicanus]TYT75860.1 hypothetical protein FIM25_02865 [Desulfobotulus mexicanus]